jgi:hypothetical protein
LLGFGDAQHRRWMDRGDHGSPLPIDRLGTLLGDSECLGGDGAKTGFGSNSSGIRVNYPYCQCRKPPLANL